MLAQVGLNVRGFEDSRQRTQDGCCVARGERTKGNELDNFGDKSGNSQHEKRCSSVGKQSGRNLRKGPPLFSCSPHTCRQTEWGVE